MHTQKTARNIHERRSVGALWDMFPLLFDVAGHPVCVVPIVLAVEIRIVVTCVV